MAKGIHGEGGMRLSKSIVGKAEADAVARVICEDGYLGMGKTTREFEEKLATYLGVQPWQVISVNSGTASLHTAVLTVLARERHKDKTSAGKPAILVPTLTFVASFQAILAAGCKPVPCDVLMETGTLDLEDARRRLTPDVIGLMHVDYASNPWQLDKVYAFAEHYRLSMIDDAAHAFGCRHHGRKIGSFGDLVCFSFDGIKNITCGEGGCLVVFDKLDAAVAADARLLGVQGDSDKRFAGERTWQPDVARPGLRYHLSNIMAAIGLKQLDRLEKEFIPARRRLYDRYASILDHSTGIKLLKTDPEDYIVPHIMPVRVLYGRRDEAAHALKLAGVPTGLHYRPNHLLTLFGGGEPYLENAEKLYSELLTLPLHPELTDGDVEEICAVIVKALE